MISLQQILRIAFLVDARVLHLQDLLSRILDDRIKIEISVGDVNANDTCNGSIEAITDS